MGRWTYNLYGLVVESEVALPELDTRSRLELPDATITIGSVAAISPGSVNEEGFAVSGESVLLEVPGVGRFAVCRGREIVVAPDRHAEEADVRLFLLGSAMGALLHQRGRLPLHASALCVEGEGVAFAAPSGGGKSTLAGLLSRRGFQMLGDDVNAVEVVEGGRVLLHPGVRRLRLNPDSLRAVGGSSDDLKARRSSDGKFDLPVPRADRADSCPELRRLYILDFSDGGTARVVIEPLGPWQSLIALRSNIYRLSLIPSLGVEGEFLRRAKEVLRRVEFFSLSRPKDLESIEEVVEVLARHLATVADSATPDHSFSRKRTVAANG